MIAIDYPTITVGERTLIVRSSLAAQVLMRRRGIDPNKLEEATARDNPDQQENWLKIFSCMVAENFLDGPPESFSLSNAPTADYIATLLIPGQRVDIVCNESLKKAAEAVRAMQPPPALTLAS